ncbi:hypothetical protein [Chryseobacterium cucumeris]|uniref:hypothetical protein n=1 Tax=Chryseobacterium cucumeris TaxID=1813611 RepID=UPI001F4B822D|nr:hypothetical protein [Chryseobacterium cucumeris]
MNVNKLFLFSKNTDAFSSQRGYNYQTLKTLEIWVENYLESKSEDIYCEFEEDIFQKNNYSKDLKFRQIKLYSSNFSFSSNEIKKCISHFFMLFVKSDYNDFTKEFIFETNTNISAQYLDNDALLLKEWVDNQHDLDEKKLCRFSEKVKEIVTEYVGKQKNEIKDNEIASEAFDIFQELDNDFWKNFTKQIKWKFIGEAPDKEFSNVKKNIESLISQLTFDNINNESTKIFGVLLEHVFTRTSQEDNENRKLTNEDLEKLILNIGTSDDKWYSSKYDYYKNIEPPTDFRIGEFFEVLDLVNYCRRKKYLHKHKNTWNPFLTFYSRNVNIVDDFRRKAIYEIVFLNNEFYEVDYENLNERNRPKGELFGFEEDIRFYYNNIGSFKDADDLENAHILINILFTIIENDNVNIPVDELKRWLVQLYRKINQKLFLEKEVNEKCKLLELKGLFLMGINRIRPKDKTEFIEFYYDILKIVDDAPLFKLSQFSERIDKYLKIYIHHNISEDEDIIDVLDKFSESLFPLVEKREGKVRLAKSQVNKAYSFLKTNKAGNILRALDLFHKAKDNYFQEDTIEGFVLALLNISQLYNSLGMHFAAKNYALASFRMSTIKELVKRLENSVALLFYSDYLQGSWFNAINIFSKYMSLRFDSNYDKNDAEQETKAIHYASFILYTMKRISTQYNHLVDEYLKHLDYVGEDIIKPLFAKIEEELKTDEKFNKGIEYQIDDFPLNDVGSIRIIQFYALGSLWKISFDNSFELLSIGEEFLAAIQIFLAEISLSKIDFHLLKSKIEIELILSDNYRPPVQKESNEVIKWEVFICFTDEKDIKKAKKHSAFIASSLLALLNNISLLPYTEFKEKFWKFFGESDLSSKQVSVNLYQKMHRDIYIKEDFEIYNSTSFQKENSLFDLPKENKFMKWQDTLSEKYDKSFSLDAIKNRNNNVKKSIYITLKELKQDPNFSVLINGYRDEGWKDWQILVNMQNFMINHKTRVFENQILSNVEDEKFYELFQKMFHKYSLMDEKDCYIKYPLEAFKSKEFKDQFSIGAMAILSTYGLESKLLTPNFSALKEFMDIRFNLRFDDFVENNLLLDIPN